MLFVAYKIELFMEVNIQCCSQYVKQVFSNTVTEYKLL